MDKFPHLEDTSFPNVKEVNVYKFANGFDYSKYDRTQMEITICSVPWDVGLIHVGNAQIGGLGNVVHFETKQRRDAWFDDLENKFTWQTKYRDYHDGGFIEVPLPYEQAVLFNYCYCEYTPLPVQYGSGGKDKFFFFIRSCEYLSPNTTKIELLRDTWQTYIYDVQINYMMLERGHAPMMFNTAERYLANPIENCQYLLAEDVSYSTAKVSRYASSVSLNSKNMYAVIVASGYLDYQTWGTKANDTWQTVGGSWFVDGNPEYSAYATAAANLTSLLNAIERTIPQFMRTVKGVFFVSGDLLNLVEMFVIANVQCYRVEQKSTTLDLLDLTKEQFGYGQRYENLAKLYTYPYAYLEVTDETGNVHQLRIEETSGDLSLTVTTSLCYPWLSLDGKLNGVGSGGGSITFANVSQKTFDFEGGWYDFLFRWEIPSFAVLQSAAKVYDYDTHYDREQRQLELDTSKEVAYANATTAKINADASADTTKTNADRSADASKANADASANTTHDNAIRSLTAAKSNADASATTSRKNAENSADTAKTNADNSADTAKTNADNSADAAKTNAINSADAAKTNARDNANTTRVNAVNSANTDKRVSDRNGTYAYNNAIRTANNAYTNSRATTNTIKGNADRSADANYNNVESDLTLKNELRKLETEFDYGVIGDPNYNGNIGINAWYSVEKIGDDWDTDYFFTAQMTNITNENTINNAIVNGVGTGINAALGSASALAFAGPQGVATGAAVGAATAAVSVAQAGMSTNIATTNNSAMLRVQQEQGQNKCNHAIDYNKRTAIQAKVHMDNQYNQTAAYTRIISTRSRDTVKINASNTQATEWDNSSRNLTTDTTNAAKNLELTNGSNDVPVGNNEIVQTTAITNADNQLATAQAAADRTYNAASTNATNTYNIALTNSTNVKNTANNNATNDKDLAYTNADNTETTAKANALRTFNAGKTNADDEQTKDLANNLRSYNAAIANNLQNQTTAKANNARSFDTATDNADAVYTTGVKGIENDVKQAAMGAPVQYGEFSNGETATTKPQGVFCNIVTQPVDAIEQAGDYFLRFGYAVNRAWEFETFNVMPKFTYWKASDMWVSGNNVPDAYLDEIRFYLLGGVCVWRNPSEIGNISIYQNN